MTALPTGYCHPKDIVPIPGVKPRPPGWKAGIQTARPYGRCYKVSVNCWAHPRESSVRKVLGEWGVIWPNWICVKLKRLKDERRKYVCLKAAILNSFYGFIILVSSGLLTSLVLCSHLQWAVIHCLSGQVGFFQKYWPLFTTMLKTIGVYWIMPPKEVYLRKQCNSPQGDKSEDHCKNIYYWNFRYWCDWCDCFFAAKNKLNEPCFALSPDSVLHFLDIKKINNCENTVMWNCFPDLR